MSTAALILAWVCLVWPVVDTLWCAIEQPYDVKYNSLVYALAIDGVYVWGKAILGALVLLGVLAAHTLAVVALVGSGLVLVWGFFKPVEMKIHDWFFATLAIASSVAMIWSAIVVV